MSRLPRRPPRIPPLRGCSAAVPPLGQTERCPRPVVRQRPPIAGGLISNTDQRTVCDQLHPSFLEFYKKWPGLFEVLDRPWKFVAGVIVLTILSMLFGRLL